MVKAENSQETDQLKPLRLQGEGDLDSSLDETSRLLSRIEYENRGIFRYMGFNVVDRIFNKKKKLDFFRTKFDG